MGARSSSLWGYFSFLIIGSSLDEKMWICCWGHIFLLFCVLFFCSSCHQSSVNTYTLMLNPFVTSSDFCLISGHNFSFFWGCNICVNRSFRMVSKEPERCLAASSRSERLGCCLFGLCQLQNLLTFVTLSLGSCDDNHLGLGRSLVRDSFELTTALCCPFFQKDDFYLSQKNGIHQPQLLQSPPKASWWCQGMFSLSSQSEGGLYLDESDKQ